MIDETLHMETGVCSIAFLREVNRVMISICSSVCRARIDLGLLIDGSGSRYRFSQILALVRQLIRFFDVSRIYTRVGIITYSTTPIPVSNFASYSRRYDLLKVIRKIRFPRGRSYTGRALRFAGRYLFTGRRSSTRARVLVVVMGSRSSDRIRRPAEMLRQVGIEIFAVGMGGGVRMTSLSAIATDRFHVFSGVRLGLRNLLSKLVAKICAATPRTKPTTKRKSGLFVCVAIFGYVTPSFVRENYFYS